jgi:hypothetical protein
VNEKQRRPSREGAGVKESSKKGMRSLLLARRSRRTGLRKRRTSAQIFDFKQGPRVLAVWNTRTRDAEMPTGSYACMHVTMLRGRDRGRGRDRDRDQRETGTETETSERDP